MCLFGVFDGAINEAYLVFGKEKLHHLLRPICIIVVGEIVVDVNLFQVIGCMDVER